jgi:hypothetical protein
MDLDQKQRKPKHFYETLYLCKSPILFQLLNKARLLTMKNRLHLATPPNLHPIFIHLYRLFALPTANAPNCVVYLRNQTTRFDISIAP